MQTVSETYARLLRQTGTIKQHRAVINGLVYDASRLVGAPRTSNSLFGDNAGPQIGQANAGQVTLTIRPRDEAIPRTAKIELFTRLADMDHLNGTLREASEWIPKGVFYIDTRRADVKTGTLTLHGFDAILLHGGQTYLTAEDVGEWPRTCGTVVADICARMGVELDQRTVLDSTVLVPYPNDWTIRELLGMIAAAHAGNWTITDAGMLRLIPLWSVPDETHYLVDEHGDPITFGGDRILVSGEAVSENPNESGSGKSYLGRDMSDFGAPPKFAPYSRVVAWYDDENAFAAGDDSGRTLECDCPLASQAIVEKMLASVQNYAYQPYEAAGAVLDPAAELGDGITADGVYSVLARCETTFNALMVSDIAAPADEEIDHEMPYETRMQLAMKRKMTLGKSYYGTRISKTKGLEIVRNAADGTEGSRALLNADTFAMYDDLGVARIFFDPQSGRYKFVGDLDISGGNINMEGGVIQWGDNNPASGKISASQAKTIISEELVASPTIAGGSFRDLGQLNRLEMGNSEDGKVAYINHFYNEFSESNPVLVMGYTNPTGANPQWVLAPFFDISLTYMERNGTMYATGKWDFSQAEVTGLTTG